VKWRYTLENDWSGDPAIFFWVIVTDEASEPRNLRQVKAAFIGKITTMSIFPASGVASRISISAAIRAGETQGRGL
jgi:hypothetical protein